MHFFETLWDETMNFPYHECVNKHTRSHTHDIQTRNHTQRVAPYGNRVCYSLRGSRLSRSPTMLTKLRFAKNKKLNQTFILKLLFKTYTEVYLIY